MSHPGNRHELGQQLRALRTAAKLRGVDLAPLIGVTQGQLSKIENGKARISPDQVRTWGEHTGADTQTIERLVEQARQADTQVTAWKERFGAGWDSYQRSYGEVEGAATGIFAYQVSVIHGLLQDPGYSEFIQRVILGLDDNQVAAGLAAMRNRQQLLYRPGTDFNVVLTEHVLRHRFPGAAVMVPQLRRIAQLATLPTVTLSIIPTDNDIPLPYMVSFDLFTAPADETDVVFIELDTQEIRETEPDRVAVYADRHKALREAEQTLKGQDAIDLVNRIADEMTASIFPTSKP